MLSVAQRLSQTTRNLNCEMKMMEPILLMEQMLLMGQMLKRMNLTWRIGVVLLVVGPAIFSKSKVC